MFSVVIPSYRHVRFLAEGVLSALTSRHVSEVLIADDGSADGSRALIGQLVRSHPDRLRELPGSGERNLGAAQRLDQLVAEARCDWVAVLNSDDAFAPGRFELLRHRCTRGVRFVAGHLLIVDEDGRHLGTKRGVLEPEYPFPPGFDAAGRAARDDVLSLLANQNFLATTSNMVFTRELHAEIGGFRDYRYVHDWDFALRAAIRGGFVLLPHYLAIYRVHGSNTIAEDVERVAAEVRAMMGGLLRDFPALRTQPGSWRVCAATGTWATPGAAPRAWRR